MAARKKPVNFEASLEALENLVEELESGELPLEDALKAFEQGIKLTRDCQQALAEAEQKVTLLTKTDHGIVETPFSSTDEDQ